MITRTTFHLQGGIDAEVKVRNISPSNRKPSAAGSGYRTENLWVTCRHSQPLCHSGYPSGFSTSSRPLPTPLRHYLRAPTLPHVVLYTDAQYSSCGHKSMGAILADTHSGAYYMCGGEVPPAILTFLGSISLPKAIYQPVRAPYFCVRRLLLLPYSAGPQRGLGGQRRHSPGSS